MSEKSKVDAAGISRLIQRAAIDYGKDWIDPNSKISGVNCQNYYNDAGGEVRHCIAAWVFKKILGPDKFRFEVPQMGSANYVFASSETLQKKLTNDALLLLSFAQRLQDQEAPWGVVSEAVKAHHLVHKSLSL